MCWSNSAICQCAWSSRTGPALYWVSLLPRLTCESTALTKLTFEEMASKAKAIVLVVSHYPHLCNSLNRGFMVPFAAHSTARTALLLSAAGIANWELTGFVYPSRILKNSRTCIAHYSSEEEGLPESNCQLACQLLSVIQSLPRIKFFLSTLRTVRSPMANPWRWPARLQEICPESLITLKLIFIITDPLLSPSLKGPVSNLQSHFAWKSRQTFSRS